MIKNRKWIETHLAKAEEREKAREGLLIFRDYCDRTVRYDGGESEKFRILRHQCNIRKIQNKIAEKRIVKHPKLAK